MMKQPLKDLKTRLAKARDSHSYRLERAVIEFTEDVTSRMAHLGLKKSELARRINAKPAYITKILRGSTNFTLESMVKIAHALDCELSTHLTPRGMQSQWFDVTRETHRFVIAADDNSEFPDNDDAGSSIATAA